MLPFLYGNQKKGEREMNEKKKKIFLLLPELSEEVENICTIPTSITLYKEYEKSHILLNVYEHYRTIFTRKKTLCNAIQMLDAFDELWYYAAFGITDPINCCIKKAEELHIPVNKICPIDYKTSFSKVYKFAIDFHPSKAQEPEYWNKAVNEMGNYSKDNPLISNILVSVFSYFEAIYKKEAPPVAPNDLFNTEFRTALNCAIWAKKNNATFDDDGDIDPNKVSKSPTPMLKALLSGYYKYHHAMQKIQETNKV